MTELREPSRAIGRAILDVYTTKLGERILEADRRVYLSTPGEWTRAVRALLPISGAVPKASARVFKDLRPKLATLPSPDRRLEIMEWAANVASSRFDRLWREAETWMPEARFAVRFAEEVERANPGTKGRSSVVFLGDQHVFRERKPIAKPFPGFGNWSGWANSYTPQSIQHLPRQPQGLPSAHVAWVPLTVDGDTSYTTWKPVAPEGMTLPMPLVWAFSIYRAVAELPLVCLEQGGEPCNDAAYGTDTVWVGRCSYEFMELWNTRSVETISNVPEALLAAYGYVIGSPIAPTAGLEHLRLPQFIDESALRPPNEPDEMEMPHYEETAYEKAQAGLANPAAYLTQRVQTYIRKLEQDLRLRILWAERMRDWAIHPTDAAQLLKRMNENQISSGALLISPYMPPEEERKRP